MNTKSKELDFEVNLLPVLSVLSICICFLLTTAIWTRMGFIGINQAIGDELPSIGKTSGQFVLQLKSGKDSSLLSEKVILPARTGQFDWPKFQSEIKRFVSIARTKTVIVMPEIGVNYGQTIHLLDQLKGLSLQVGLAPAIKGVR